MSTETPQGTPRYLQFLALVSFHAFIEEKVDVAIYECHHGGEFDATNVIQQPVVTAVTPTDQDHIRQLGPWNLQSWCPCILSPAADDSNFYASETSRRERTCARLR